jgi:hypothetical protein
MADDWDQFAEVSTDDALGSLTGLGVDVTSGFRTEGDNERLRREGYRPATNSHHLDGDAVDLTPGKSGLSMAQLEERARALFGPDAKFLNEGDHLHVTVAGWGGAPDTYRSDPWTEFDVVEKAKPAKPQAEQPDSNPGVVTGREFADSATYLPSGAAEYADALHSAIASGQAKSHPELVKVAQDWNAAHGTDFGMPINDKGETDAFIAATKKQKFGVAAPRMNATAQKRMEERIAANKDTPEANATLAGGLDTVTRGGFDEASGFVDAAGDFLSGKGFDYTSNVNADRAYIDAVQAEHPNYYLSGQIAGAFVDPIMPNASGVGGMAKVGAVEGGVYGFNEADGSLADRATGAAVGAVGGMVAGPVVGKTLEAAGAVVRKVFGREAPAIADEAAASPLEADLAQEAVGQQEAAMRAGEGPSVASGRVPDRINVEGTPEPGTPEQRAVAAQVEPEQVTQPSLSDLAKAGNINLSRIDKPEDIDALMKFTTDSFDEFKLERRGEQSWAATEALAKDLGMTPDELLGRQTGEAFNAEQSLAARKLLHASADETRQLAQAAINGSEADKATFVKAFLLHAAITEKASGAAAEAGRALNIYRKVAKASLGDREAMQAAVKRLQDGATVDDVAAMVNSLADDPSALNRFARDAIKPAFKDKLMFVWINSLLSGPKTHIVNMTSNLVTALMDVPEQAIAAGIGAVRKAAGGSSDRVLMSEVGPGLYGTLRGAGDALAAAKKGWAEEAGGKIDAVRPAIGGKAGKIIGLPTRLLNVEDEIFKAMARRSEMAKMAVRKARMEGLRGDELKSRIDYLATNPTDEMKQAAADAALYKTFQRPLGPAMQKVSSALQAAPILRLFVPFIRTPTNLLKYAIERSPAAPLLKEVRAEFVAGGAKRDLAIAKMVLGTGIGTLVAGLAADGRITGNGPADPSAKKALEADGWQPYSFKIGGEYISYRRLDPWATIIGSAADAIELQSAMTDKQRRDAGAIVIGAATQNLASKTWLSGLSDLIDAITDPKANAKNVITRLGASIATPTLASQVAQLTDPVVRDTSDPSYMGQLRKKIEARIPVLSTDVIARRDILGKEVRNEGGPIARLLSPFDTRQVRRDPVAKAIYDSGARFSLPSREVGGGRLSDQDFDAYQKAAAQKFYDAMKETLADPQWLTMSRDEQRKVIEKAKNKSREEARGELFGMEH